MGFRSLKKQSFLSHKRGRSAGCAAAAEKSSLATAREKYAATVAVAAEKGQPSRRGFHLRCPGFT